jgi:hypothetical protein
VGEVLLWESWLREVPMNMWERSRSASTAPGARCRTDEHDTAREEELWWRISVSPITYLQLWTWKVIIELFKGLDEDSQVCACMVGSKMNGN